MKYLSVNVLCCCNGTAAPRDRPRRAPYIFLVFNHAPEQIFRHFNFEFCRLRLRMKISGGAKSGGGSVAALLILVVDSWHNWCSHHTHSSFNQRIAVVFLHNYYKQKIINN
jgi:hypothetical protein